MEAFLYHSFPRRSEPTPQQTRGKGIRILRSILQSGLLLTPEPNVPSLRLSFDESIISGPTFIQRRACLTLLRPDELDQHCRTFGDFAIELDPEAGSRLGAVPTFYLPLQENSEEDWHTGRALLAWAVESQAVFRRIADLHRGQLDDNTRLALHVAGITREQAMTFLLKVLDNHPASGYEGALIAICNQFYPVENVRHGSPLGYYQQREWRILGSLGYKRLPSTRSLTPEELTTIEAIDPAFFGREIQFPSGPAKMIDRARILEGTRSTPLRSLIRRIICPIDSVVDVQALALEYGLNTPVTHTSAQTTEH